MGYAEQLAEAVEALAPLEQKSFLDCLDEHVSTAMYTGYFTEETMESALAVIMREAGATEDDLDEVNEAIDEFVDEALTELRDETKARAKAFAKKHGKRAGKSVGKEIARHASGPLAKRVAGIKTKSKTGKMLKHAAAGAVKQIGRDPGKAKEILKKSAKKAGKKLLKRAVKKGMKMVFGKWLKAKNEEIEELEERKRSSKRAEVERAFAKRGVVKMPRINPREYPKIRGMEGPFQFRDGRILYYDPREGRYYDSKTDMYLARNDIPEDVQEMLTALAEVDGFDEFAVLTEGKLAKGLQGAFEKAMDVEMDKRQAKMVSDEFVKAFRKSFEQKMRDEVDEPEVEDWTSFDFEDEFDYTPRRYQNISVYKLPGPGYYDETASVSGKTKLVTKMSSSFFNNVGIPDAVDLMAGMLKRIFGNDAFIAARRNLARALLGNKRLLAGLIEDTATIVLRSWKKDDLDTDAWEEEIRRTLLDQLSSRDEIDWEVTDIGEYTVTLDRINVGRSMKLVSSSAGPGSDVQTSVKGYWRLSWKDYPEIKADPP